jgi:hypothetical protein
MAAASGELGGLPWAHVRDGDAELATALLLPGGGGGGGNGNVAAAAGASGAAAVPPAALPSAALPAAPQPPHAPPQQAASPGGLRCANVNHAPSCRRRARPARVLCCAHARVRWRGRAILPRPQSKKGRNAR